MALVEWLNLCVLVTGRLWIDVDDVAVRCIQLHVDVLGFAEALREKARSNEQHKGKRRLQDNECALQEAMLRERSCERWRAELRRAASAPPSSLEQDQRGRR